MASKNWLLQPTGPTADPSYQPSDNTRSTSDLIKTSLVTLLLCAWTVLHRNIPLSTRRKQRWVLLRNKLWYAVQAMLMPEMVLHRAFRQLWEARLVCQKLEEIGWKEPRVGRVGDAERGESVQLACADANPNANNNSATPTATGEQEETQTSAQTSPSGQSSPVTGWRAACKFLFPDDLEIGFFLTMGGIEIERKQDSKQRRQLTPQGVVLLAEARILEPLSADEINDKSKSDRVLQPLSADEINDKSKSDRLAKLLAIAQASWLFLQCIVRKLNNYPLSPLEIHIVTHVICTLGMYLLWLKKPQNVHVTKILPLDERYIHLLVDNPDDFARGKSRYLIKWDPSAIISERTDQGSLVQPHDESGFSDFSTEEVIDYLCVPMYAAYGALHLVPWNAHFPTNLERIIWRVCVVINLGGPILLIIIRLMRPILRRRLKNWGFVMDETVCPLVRRRVSSGEIESPAGRKKCWLVRKLHTHAVFLALAVYTPVRLFFLVESFASLRSLEVGTLKNVGWLGVVPHV